MNRFEFKTDEDGLAFARHLATALGPEWSAQPLTHGPHYIEIRSTNDQGTLVLSTQYGDDKLRISGRFPHHNDLRSPSGHSIGVSPTRSFPIIAAEIKRRLLPEYVIAREKYLAVVAEFERRKANDFDVARKLAKLAGTTLDKNGNREEVPQFYTDGYSVRVTVSGGKVSLDRVSSMSPEVAAKVIKVLSVRKKGGA